MKNRPPRAGLRYLAAAVLLLQIGSFGAHFGLVEHKVCAAHGELIHGADHHAEADRALPAVAGAPTSHHDHDVCGLWQSLHQTDLDTGPAVGLPPSGPAVALLAATETFATRAAWRLAPKTSPPRA